MATLYELTGQILELQDMFESGDYDEQIVNDTLDSVMMDLEDKADAYGKMIRNMEANLAVIDGELERLKSKKDALKNGIKRMKDRIGESLVATGLDETGISGELFKFKFRNNAPQLPKDISFRDVPKEYWKEKDPEVDRVKLLKDVKAGKEDVKGIELVRSRSLQMR